MKKFLLSVLAVAGYTYVNAQCSELFISEYVEGSGNNKALEIYNPTNAAINLSSYRLIRWDNGSVIADTDPAQVQPLPNVSIAAKDVYVIALNLTDPSGTGQSAPIDTALQARADILLSNGCGTDPGNIRVMCFNGDDALSLQKNVGGTWTNVDIFASIGERPTNSSGTYSPTAGWTNLPPFSSMPAGYTTATDGPYFMRYWTQDNTLRRKASIEAGVTTNPSPQTFDPSVQWDSLPENTFDGLGTHNCNCNLSSVKEDYAAIKVNIYPNPATDLVTVSSSAAINTIEVRNILGQVVYSKNVKQNASFESINTVNFPRGVYMIEVTSNGKRTTQKVVVK